MAKISTEPEPYDLFCQADWFYYLVNYSKSGGRDYRHFKNDLTHNIAITEQEFTAAKCGLGIAPFEQGEEVVPLPDGGTVRCFFQSSAVRVFDRRGALLRTLPDAVNAGGTIYSIALDAKGHLWTAEPTFDFVTQVADQLNSAPAGRHIGRNHAQ